MQVKCRGNDINDRLRVFLEENDKKSAPIATKANIRQDTFSRIVNSKRPIFADEIVPICDAAGCSVDYLLGVSKG